jgi:hypothetical protein
MSDELLAVELVRAALTPGHELTHVDNCAAWQLAKAYLAEHPADDEEPVNEEWLRSIGLKLRMGFGFPVTKTMSLWDSRNGWGLYFHGGLGDSAEGETKIANVATRGQVRRLLVALGIAAK